MHGQSSERPGMEDNAEAEQNSLAQAEPRTYCAGLLCRWPQRSRVITDPHTFKA